MTIYRLKESLPPSSNSDNDGDDDTNLEILKLSEVLSGINVFRCYISAKSCFEKALNSLISLLNEVFALNARKMKQTKLSHQVQNNI